VTFPERSCRMRRRHPSLLAVALALGVLCVALPGCSFIIANAGISGLREIPETLTRLDVRERFGSPASTSTTSAGRPIDIYLIRRQLDCVVIVGSNQWCQPKPQSKDWVKCLLMGPLCAYSLMLVGISESVSLPINVARSEANKFEVAFVYGPDERVLYFYETSAFASLNGHPAITALTHPLSSEFGLPQCATVKQCMEEYNQEVKLRAAEIGHTLTSEDEEAMRRDLVLAGNVHDGTITFAEAVRLRSPEIFSTMSRDIDQFVSQHCDTTDVGELRRAPASQECSAAMVKLRGHILQEIAESTDTLTPIVAGYIEKSRKFAAAHGDSLTCEDEMMFQLALEITKHADESRITKQEALTKLETIVTRHMVHNYQP
jgi:hypothetical protein